MLLECHIRAAAPNAKSSSSVSFENHIDKVKLITLNRLGTKDTLISQGDDVVSGSSFLTNVFTTH